MNFRPAPSLQHRLCFMTILLMVILSCSADRDILSEYVIEEEIPIGVQEGDSLVDGNGTYEEPPEITESDYLITEMEDRTTAFPAVEDAYIQNGQGYNREIVLLEEDVRTSYLMFDLSQIDSINGYITAAKLQFVVNQDNGEGKIEIFKGTSNDWTEDNLSDSVAPDRGAALGVTQQVFDTGELITIPLDPSELLPTAATLILSLEGGDAFAFASKENRSVGGSELIIDYKAPIGSAAIAIVEEEVIEVATEEDPSGETENQEVGNASENAAPTPIVSASRTSGTAPLRVTFIGSASADDKGIVAYAWDFKDGNSATTVNPEHVYAQAGVYEAELTVTDAEGLAATEFVIIRVNAANQSPIAQATANIVSGTAPLTVSFSGSGSSDDTGIATFSWDFRDGNTASTENAVNTFNGAGTFDVILTVTDADGLSSSESVTITVTGANQAPVAKASASTISGIAPLEVNFTGSESSDDAEITVYSWDFKDGNTATTANAVNTFTEPGTYAVVLRVTDGDDLSATETITITVAAPNAPPVADISANTVSGAAPLLVNFIGSESTDDNRVTSYAWDFKDGNTATIANTEHTFNDKGNYNVSLTVTDEEGLSSTETLRITVTEANTAPIARIAASSESGIAPFGVNFTGSGSTDDKGIVRYSWNFKDGSSANTANAEHTFTVSGTYNVSLVVTDEEGLSASETLEVTVTGANEAPVAEASASVVSGTVPLTVDFNGSRSTDDNGVTDYDWDFKDGNTATRANPVHTFTEKGTYVVSLTVTDASGLTGEDTISIRVEEPENEAPVAVATASTTSGYAPLQVDFGGSNSSDDTGIASYSWDFPGGSSSNVNTSYTFENPGVYTVILTVTDDEELTSADRLTISVIEEERGNIDCSTGGGLAGDTGEKIWCWRNITIPEYSQRKGIEFSNGQLKTDSDCYERQVTREGDRLKFSVNPTSPPAESWCDKDYNIRAEITTFPFAIQHPAGTEEWLGWTYEFGSNYQIDEANPFIMFQFHNGIVGTKPLLSLWVTSEEGQFNAGEISLVNSADTSLSNQYYPTGIYPRAGQKLKMVTHVVWGDDNTGRLRIWINDVKVHDTQRRTIQREAPYGGNAKWGIYKWKWEDQEGVQASQEQGISSIETYLGTLRIVTRRPGDAGYGTDAYSLVEPD